MEEKKINYQNEILLSVVVPTYNRAKYLDRCLKSVLFEQVNSCEFELIVNDNASPDNTQDIVQEYLEDPRIKYYRNEENIGMVRNFYVSTKRANGKYVLWLSDDDWLLPNAISDIMKVISAYPEVGYIFSPLPTVDDRNGKVFYTRKDFENDQYIEAGINNMFKYVDASWAFSRQVLKKDYIDWKTWERNVDNAYNLVIVVGRIMLNYPFYYIAKDIVMHTYYNKVHWEEFGSNEADIELFTQVSFKNCMQSILWDQPKNNETLAVIKTWEEKSFKNYLNNINKGILPFLKFKGIKQGFQEFYEKYKPSDEMLFQLYKFLLNKELFTKSEELLIILNKIKNQIDRKYLDEINILEGREKGDLNDNWQLTTPVAFVIFNRPDTTQKVFNAIREAKPPKLLVIADGARIDKEGEAELCKQTRAIINQVDWDCEVLVNYSDVNLGCRKRVSSGLDWVFEQVEEAIILEDDCLPHPTFFRYCQELLEKYRDDERIMMISGDNFQFGRKRSEYSYYFSRYGHIWGWASWRRAWIKNDDSMSQWEELRDSSWLFNLLQNDQAVAYWSRIFQSVYDGFNTWDYIWVFTMWANNGLCILPEVNLVSNIGFGSGTHTTTNNSPFANMRVSVMEFPLKHPQTITRNIHADNFTEQTQFSGAVYQKMSSQITSKKCKVCDSDSHYFASAKILQKYDVKYYQCGNCGFVQTEEPYWLNEAYTDAIAPSDVGLLYRNNMMANITAKLLFNYFDHEAKFLDYGGGYGVFVRLMRDQGFDFYWQDKYCQNLFATGFELKEKDKSELLLITAFELFEHLTYPIQELEEMLKLAPNILFSTSLLPDDNPKPDQWWYYIPHEGQHIAIYTQKSLEILAERYNLKLYTDGSSLHLLTTNKDLPANLFDLIKTGNVKTPTKESFLSHDFNQVVSKILNKNNTLSVKIPEIKSPIIVIDGVFFQLNQTGIARVWKSLLEQWANTEFANHILVFDRANTAPKINGIRYRTIQPYNPNNLEGDRTLLQQICDEEKADLFISTYYTIPKTTKSVMLIHDLIPEVMGWEVDHLYWKGKHDAINYASSFISASKNTAQDLQKFFPETVNKEITVALWGADQDFGVVSPSEIMAFRHKYNIQKPYYLLVGNEGFQGYKNQLLFFQAFAELPTKSGFDIVWTGNKGYFPEQYRQYIQGCSIHSIQLSDQDLKTVYNGAIALVFPSKYEGFGFPVLEAMTCGCPVITCPNSSIPEVGGDAVFYVNPDDLQGMIEALCEVQKPRIRDLLRNKGFQQAQKFSWTKTAEICQNILLENAQSINNSFNINFQSLNLIIFPDWQQDEEELSLTLTEVLSAIASHPQAEEITLIIDITNAESEEDAQMLVSAVTMNLILEEGIELPETIEISFIGNLTPQQWEKLFNLVQYRVKLDTEYLPICVEKLSSCQIQDISNLPITISESDLLDINFQTLNLIIFPDWQQDEEELSLTLTEVLGTIASHPQAEEITLIIDITNVESEEDAQMLVSAVTMNLILEEGIELPETTQIAFISNLTTEQEKYLAKQLNYKINLSSENKSLIQGLNTCSLEEVKTLNLSKITSPLILTDDPVLPKIDVVLQSCGAHGWNMWRGWVNVLAKQGLLHRVFAPIANWNDQTPLNDDGLWEYLEKPTGDIMLLSGFDWHSQPLHRSPQWQEKWQQAKIEKIALFQENYSAQVTQNNSQWQEQMLRAITTASQCLDRIICHHEPDVQFLKDNYQLTLPIKFLSFAIDPQFFRTKKPFHDKINQAGFRGNISAYFSKNTYSKRRELIDILRNSGEVDILEYTYQSVDKNEFISTDGVENYSHFLNKYRIQLNLPSISQTLTNRPVEVMACGGVLLQNHIIGEESKTFFEDGKHLIFYDENNPENLINMIKDLKNNPDLAEKIAKEGQKICYEHHTLFDRVIAILDWLNYDIKTQLKPDLIKFMI
ncbi:glycosyltransferase [Cyanobacterium aponinum]|uniref:glycosyltransferase n=1 Tax=Cyanobacterium aponinum TaxID=379064 RepID=UPI000C13E812|nr:glycosyltransferase [Cyanobacterium aponinum]PHV62799.1 hypothetical protein CSQ80_08775 [Cyanobacterium aponinum IPPAS B-1201]